MTQHKTLMALCDAYADAECDYRMSGKATSCQEEYASDQARAALSDALRTVCADADRYKFLRDNCPRLEAVGMKFVQVPDKWIPEHQTTTHEDDAAIDAAMQEQP